MNDTAGVGATIKKLRVLAGLKQKELARLLDVDASYLSRLERGEREPSLDLLRRVSEALALPPGLLMAMALWTDLPQDQRGKYAPVVRQMLELTELFQPTLSLDPSREGTEEP